MIKKQDYESYLMAGIMGLSKINALCHACIADLRQMAKPVLLKKGDVVVAMGSSLQGIYFMIQGLGRSYTYKGGTEITSWIIQEGEPFGNYRSYCLQVPTREATEIIESGFAFYLSRTDMQALCAKYIAFANVIIILNERNFIKMDDFVHNTLYKSADERYEIFMKAYPTIFNRMRLKHIASFLNMNPATLSRIRAKI